VKEAISSLNNPSLAPGGIAPPWRTHTHHAFLHTAAVLPFYRPDAYPHAEPSAPLVLDSPHSGTEYPPDFSPALAHGVLRTAEDTWVADLWGDAPAQGVPLLAARFPRSYIDANRNIDEIDSTLFETPWPEPLPDSPKVKLAKA